ncbi:MAG: heat shock protein HspQ [Phycisphaerales bacterium JB063]
MSQHQPINIPDYFPGELPAFRVGQIVRHKRYGYRGVVVDFDMACLADDTWYDKNKTKPRREQPWYHILVHGSNGNTYAAEDSLVADALDEPIEHPLVSVFFEAVDHGQYERNDEHWPGWNG